MSVDRTRRGSGPYDRRANVALSFRSVGKARAARLAAPKPGNDSGGGLHPRGFDLAGTELKYLEQRNRLLILLYREGNVPPVLRDDPPRRADADAVAARSSIFCQSRPDWANCSCSALRR